MPFCHRSWNNFQRIPIAEFYLTSALKEILYSGSHYSRKSMKTQTVPIFAEFLFKQLLVDLALFDSSQRCCCCSSQLDILSDFDYGHVPINFELPMKWFSTLSVPLLNIQELLGTRIKQTTKSWYKRSFANHVLCWHCSGSFEKSNYWHKGQ